MKAIVISEGGGPESLRLKDVADPTPGPAELLVRVRATALNRADLLQTLGLYPPPPDVPKDIPGLEYAGEVAAVGARVQRFKVGDHVMGIVGGGAFAEYVVCHEREAIAIPSRMNYREAAAIPEAFLTAYDALVLQAGLRGGETVLIHAAGSGVGTAAVQIASALGARAIGTVRTPEKLTALKSLGLHHGIVADRELPAFAREVKSVTDGVGVDVVLDLVTGGTAGETLDSIAPRGRWLMVGMVGGASASLELASLLRKRITVFGTVLRSRPLEEKIALARAVEKSVIPLFVEGRLRPVIDNVYPSTNVTDAFARLSSNASFGKIVLEWP